MQFGLMPWAKISPASLMFKAWHGLYENNGNFLYVNRGLGTMGLPIRLGMPPEVTVITLNVPNE